MIADLFFASALLAPPTTASESAPPVPLAAQTDVEKEYEQRRKAAGDDVAKLWELHLWCTSVNLESKSRSCLNRIVKLEPNHRQAHEALGHVEHEGQWFPSQKKLDEHKQQQALRDAKEKGLVKYKDTWVAPEDVPFLERGLVKDENGQWVNQQERERIAAGWVRQDLEWVSPEEKPNLEKKLWKCGTEWKSLEEANRYHATIDTWWSIPSEHYLLHTTCDRAVALRAIDEMERAYTELERAFGATPARKLAVVLLRDSNQYSEFAAGEPQKRSASELTGLSSVHHAYFADFWIDPKTNEFGAGVGLWDASNDKGNKFGVHAARHAAGQAYADAIDPSTKAVEKLVKELPDPNVEAFGNAFWTEKQIPTWYRYAAVAYGERYFVDNLVRAGGNPYWAREWSVGNILARGGLRPLKQLYEFKIGVDDKPDAEKLINEAGLVMAFVLDGECKPVKEKHEAVKAAIRERKGIDKAVEALQAEVLKNEAALRTFGKL